MASNSANSSSSSSAITGVRNDVAWRPAVPVGHSDYTWGKLGQAAGARVTPPEQPKQQKKEKAKKGKDKPAGSSASSAAASAASSSPPPPPAGPAVELGKPRPSGALLPQAGKRNILITSALPYVNNVPHLGNIIGCVLSADVYARFCRLRGHNAIYICGTDEYGTATERKALEEGLTPKQVCDKFHVIHKKIYEWFNIGFDQFGRTTTEQQTAIAQDIFLHLEKNGWSLEKDTKELYCDAHQKFLADRFVEGTCPRCQYEDARGDQCDKCGNTLDAIELINPQCKMCKEALAADPSTSIKPPRVVESNHLFLDLERLQPQLTQWIDEAKVKGFWSENAIQITQAQLALGLKPRPITKDLQWGTPVPKPGYEKKVFYVWFDAPIGYLSITANYTDQWQQWWKNPKDVELVQFMGKDNIPFHTVLFPSTLMAAETGAYTLLHHVSCTEYLNYEGTKFSKSRNTGVFGDDAISTGIPSEVWRYYLLWNRPEQADTVFLWEDFAAKNNTELLANLGNFINRSLAFLHSKCDNRVPNYTLTPADEAFIAEVSAAKSEYIDLLEKVAIKEALKCVMALSRKCNHFLQDNKPWELYKTDRARCDTILFLSVNLISTLSLLLEPFMPSLSEKINAQLNQKLVGPGALSADDDKQSRTFTFNIPPGHPLGHPSPLFRKIEDEEIAALRLRFSGAPAEKKKGEPFPLNLLLGTVEAAREHEAAPHLTIVTLRTDEPESVATAQKLLKPGYRQVVAGLRPHYEPASLVGKRVGVLANIKPSNFKGVRSEGMLLTTVKGKTMGLLTVAASSAALADRVPVGAQIVPRDCVAQPKPNFDPKKELKRLELMTRGADGVVHFGSAPLQIELPGGAVVDIAGENVGEGAGVQ